MKLVARTPRVLLGLVFYETPRKAYNRQPSRFVVITIMRNQDFKYRCKSGSKEVNPMAENILKIRDDERVVLNCTGDEFEIKEGKSLSWLASDKTQGKINLSTLRSGIEPWLTSLFQSEHLSLLVGTGLTYSLNKMVTTSNSNTEKNTTAPETNGQASTNSKKELMDIPNITSEKYKELILSSAKEIAEKNHRGNPNIEDTIRVINEMLRGLEILGHSKIEGEPTPEQVAYTELKKNLEQIIFDFTVSSCSKNIPTRSSSRACPELGPSSRRVF